VLAQRLLVAGLQSKDRQCGLNLGANLFFYVDESGNTGTNLFDAAQPVLYYGVLSSKVNLDLLAAPYVRKIRHSLGVDRLHASELGNGRLVAIAADLHALQRRFRFTFDLFKVVKPDHAIICFFDQVFDHGNNPATTWTGYWTPLRYLLLLQVASLFDDDLALKAWQARICRDDLTAHPLLIEVCKSLLDRVHSLQDKRVCKLISDALQWAIRNPRELSYNAPDDEAIRQVAPNIVGFQCVMHGIANRIESSGRKASIVTVDLQSQFNKSQTTLARYYSDARGVSLEFGPGMPTASFKHMPTVPISFLSSAASSGLELVDIYLWIFKRINEGKGIAPELYSLAIHQPDRGIGDEVSLSGIDARWSKFFSGLPELGELSNDQLARARELMAIDESRRLYAMRGESA